MPNRLFELNKGKGEKMLKVGRKRKRKEKKGREKAHKLDCQDSRSRFSASC